MTCVLQKKSTQGWFGRPHPGRKTHMCAITRVWPTKKYTSVSQKKYTQGCMQGFRESRNTSCCCEHTHVCCRISKLGVAQGSGVTRAWPTRCCCEHTHVRSEKTAFIQGCTQGSKVVWGRPTNCCCKHTHVCVAESHVNSRLAPRIKKVQELGRPNFAATRCCCEHTHVMFRKKPHSFKVAPKD